MQLPHIQMSSVHGKIGLQSNRPAMSIKQPQADLTIKQQHVGTIKISRSEAKLTIDQTEAFADANLISPIRSSKQFLDRTKSEVFAYISKVVQQSDQLQKIENGGGSGTFAQISAANSVLFGERSYNYGTMPKNAFRVKMNYQPSELHFQVTKSEPDIQVKKNDPQITIPKWKIDAYVRQKNQLTIQAVGLQTNLQM